MKETSISSFRGCAGEVVAGFVHPGTWFTLIPIFGCYIVIGIISALLQSSAVAGILGYLLGSYLIGRFALPAAQGELDVGFYAPMIDSGDIGRFMVRHFLALLVWELPVIGLLYVLGSSFSLPFLSPFSLLAGGLSALFGFALVILLFAGPGISTIIAAGTDEVGDVFRWTSWRGSLIERRHDLVVFFASLIGGGIFFFIAYLIPAAALVMFIASQSIQFANISGPLLMSMPVLASPILLGRLAGAFCYGWDELKGIGSKAPMPENVLEGAKLPPSPVVKPIVAPASESVRIAAPSELNQELIAKISTTLRAFPDVARAYLYERVSEEKSTSVVGLEIDPEAKFAARQKALSDARSALGHGNERQVEILTLDKAAQVEEVGLRVYQKKSG